MSLDLFFKVKRQRRLYFYLDWTQSRPTAQWLITKPTQINFEQIIKWKDIGYLVTICGYSDPSNYLIPLDTIYNHTHISVLKSHLQKCIRRQLHQKALLTAWHLCKLDLNELLRRLPIIMIEDVKLTSHISTLIWLMSAVSKGYKLGLLQLQWILTLVLNLSQINETEDYSPTSHLTTRQMLTLLETSSELNLEQISCLQSLLFRISYGGMSGDLQILLNTSTIWQQRFITGKSLKLIDEYSHNIDLENLPDLLPIEIDRSAIDYHCFPQLLTQLHHSYSQYTIEDIKKCVWEYNSKYNVRKNEPPDPLYYHLWQQISELFQIYQQKLQLQL